MGDARRTKIVATVGPASSTVKVLAAMAAEGMDVARVPLAHGSIDDAAQLVRIIRSVAPDVAIMADLPGPKIRAARFPGVGVALTPGSSVRFEPAVEGASSDAHRIGVCHPDVVAGLHPGDRVALGDGGVVLVVERVTTGSASAVVRHGGHVQGRPGITVPSGRVDLKTPTADDLERLAVMVDEGVDAVAVSFVRSAATTAAGWRAAVDQGAACVVACTRSGTTARSISRFRPPMPLIACTPSERTARQLKLSWGVQTLIVGEASSTDEIVWFAVQAVVGAGHAKPGDVVVVLAGSPIEPEPATDTMRLVRIH